jgi:pyrroline-5-carboxylate reductase
MGETNPFERPLLVVGGGNMGKAIVLGAVAAGALAGERVVVLEPDAAKHAALEAVGAFCSASAEAAVERYCSLEMQRGPGAVLLAVKPQMLGEVARELRESLRTPERLMLSILAGVTTARLSAEVGGRIVRLMPNTPAMIRRGITAVCAGPGATEEDLRATRSLFESVGRVIDLPEDLLDAFTAVAGSGPAYVFYLAEGMAAGAEAVGFSHEQALEIVRATVAGAAGLMEAEAGVEPSELRARVTSKGGTTAAAAAVLDGRGVMGAVGEAVVAARDRGRELGAD